MALFVIICLSAFIVAYLIAITVQILHIERTVTDSARYLENKISRIYQGEDEKK